jgi:hypothetical protein
MIELSIYKQNLIEKELKDKQKRIVLRIIKTKTQTIFYPIIQYLNKK